MGAIFLPPDDTKNTRRLEPTTYATTTIQHFLAGGTIRFVEPWSTARLMAIVAAFSMGLVAVLAILAIADASAVAHFGFVLMWALLLAWPFAKLRDAIRDRAIRWPALLDVIENWLVNPPVQVKLEERRKLLKLHSESGLRLVLGAVRCYWRSATFAFAAITPFLIVIVIIDGWAHPFLLASSLTATLIAAAMAINLIVNVNSRLYSIQKRERLVDGQFGGVFE